MFLFKHDNARCRLQLDWTAIISGKSQIPNDRRGPLYSGDASGRSLNGKTKLEVAKGTGKRPSGHSRSLPAQSIRQDAINFTF